MDYQKAPNSPKLCRDNMLRGAKARAEIVRQQGGGFAGLVDAAEAVSIGERARDLQVNRRALYVESEPDVWHDGALYVTDVTAQRARDANEVPEELRGLVSPAQWRMEMQTFHEAQLKKRATEVFRAEMAKERELETEIAAQKKMERRRRREQGIRKVGDWSAE